MTDAARRESERGREGGGRSAKGISASISERESESDRLDREERRIEDSRLHRSSYTDGGGERRGWETVGEGEDKRRPLCHSSRRSTEVRLDATRAERGNRRDFVILKRTEETDKRKERVFVFQGGDWARKRVREKEEKEEDCLALFKY